MKELIFSGLRMSTPLLFVAYAGILSERAGIANIVLESYLLVGAFAAAATATITHNPTTALFVATVSVVLWASLYFMVCHFSKADQIIIGMGFNMLAVGLIPLLNNLIFGNSGSTPMLALGDRFAHTGYFVATAIVLAILLHLFFKKTKLGLRIHVAGENPFFLETQGISVFFTRLWAMIIGAVIAALGGVFLSIVQGSSYQRNMSAGRGFLAIAAMILGRWRPLPTLFACMVFGIADSAQMFLQGKEISGKQIPNQLIQILPFVVCFALLFISKKKNRAPSAINQPNFKQG